jgi:D-alanyl-D-alanine carboxypeptidase
MRKLLGFFLHFTVLSVFLTALLMPSCQGRHPEHLSAGQDSKGLEMARLERERDTLVGVLEQLKNDPGLKDSEIGYMIIDCTDSLPMVIAECEPSRALIPASTLKLFVTGAALEIFGQPIFREVMTINQLSINWRSSKLLRKIGAAVYGESSNTSGYRAIMEFWAGKGLDLTGIRFDDGNGLSRNNAISPKHLVDLLYIMRNSDYFNIFYSSLPIAWYTGTMRKALLGTTAAGKVHAKTGTIAGVKSWAGYVSTNSGRNLIFAIIVNNYSCRQKEVKKKFEQVMVRMTQV